MDFIGHQLVWRLWNYQNGFRVPEEVSAGRWQDPARDLAERITDSLVHRLRISLEQRRWLATLCYRPRRSLAGNRPQGFSPDELGFARPSLSIPCCIRPRQP